MAHLDSILRSEYLLSLFDGTRLKPVISTDNPFGYTPNDIAMDPTTGIQTIIKADDIFHYDYDLKRSYQLLLLVFAESLAAGLGRDRAASCRWQLRAWRLVGVLQPGGPDRPCW